MTTKTLSRQPAPVARTMKSTRDKGPVRKIRVLVVDDQHVVRDGIVQILSFQTDIHVVGEAADGIQAVEKTREVRPDVVLLDMVMPRQDGLATIPQLLALDPSVKILVLTSFSESNRAYQAVRAGALGYMLKDITRTQLVQSIRDVAAGQPTIHPSMAVKVIHDFDHPAGAAHANDMLTRRELESLRLIARGLSNQEIAAELVVHERTIAKYVSSILNKLHVANRTQAALYAISKGLAVPAME